LPTRLLGLKRYAEAETLLDRTLATSRRPLDPDHDRTINPMTALTDLDNDPRRHGESAVRGTTPIPTPTISPARRDSCWPRPGAGGLVAWDRQEQRLSPASAGI
jgi:hypothetical protein